MHITRRMTLNEHSVLIECFGIVGLVGKNVFILRLKVFWLKTLSSTCVLLYNTFHGTQHVTHTARHTNTGNEHSQYRSSTN